MGGQIRGPGSGISDSILARVSNGEYVLNAHATRKNLPLLEAINFGKLPGFATGGQVNPDVSAAEKLVGTPYSQASRFDCSGSVARVINAALGTDGGGLMSTKTAQAWLAARGFVNGLGGPGQISVGWYDHGPNPNDGHMAMTLSDGRHAESGGSHGAFLVGAGAAGADSPQFDHHMYLPNVYGQGPADASASPFAGGSAVAAALGAGSAPEGTDAAETPAGDGKGGFTLPTSLSGLATLGIDNITGAAQAKSGPGHRDPLGYFGTAFSKALGGQISSFAGVAGVNETPAWAQGLSSAVDWAQSNFGEGPGSSAAPISATSTMTGTPPPDEPHGTRAGQAPGPQTNYYISTAKVEDAFIQANRIAQERALVPIARF